MIAEEIKTSPRLSEEQEATEAHVLFQEIHDSIERRDDGEFFVLAPARFAPSRSVARSQWMLQTFSGVNSPGGSQPPRALRVAEESVAIRRVFSAL
ncbi:hypothetical protein CJ179_35025 [Rhodococcus sp. ACS1]|uniref:hypothetical protein n=1 Tax=Rhodococcus sp. ACS1 TaxID=2028570 RepID=UPI000BB0D004|nr:hypothetical protein [Rhodococcus sp. ACS1]PBC39271.1 hypothetical protein CJ179_35025 [Rhodococcus sp. ACS1]